MGLSNDLISQFVKITKDDKKAKQETTIYGTIVEYENSKYVRFDGSDLLTPATMTVDAEPGERVSVLLKDHTATVTGNISSPAARNESVTTVSNTVTGMGEILADKVSAQELAAQTARIDTLEANDVTVNGTLTAQQAVIDSLEANNVTINERLTANEAAIKDMEVGNLDAETLHATFANIDFSNITKATMEYFYANSGLIKNVTIGDSTITGTLVGVTITGDLIEGNTVVADKLVIKGEDGLYYKLNTDGMRTEAEQTDYNSLNGTVIKAKSITASKVSVSDLVAFDATIGGFSITEDSIYSGVKESVNNTTRGIYLDNDGQVAFGDNNRFVKFYKDTDGSYKLLLRADGISFGLANTDLETALNNNANAASNAARTATNYMDLSTDNGLVIGDHTGAQLYGNIQLKAETNGASIALRDGSTVLTKFSATSRTFSGITSASTSTSDETVSDEGETGSTSSTVTYSSQTVSSNQTADIVKFESVNPIYFSEGIRTDGVTINDDSLIANVDFTLNGCIYDRTGRSVIEPIASGGDLNIGAGRFKNATSSSTDWTNVYGNKVGLRSKNGVYIQQNGMSCFNTLNGNGNMTIGYHLYRKAAGNLNLYGGDNVQLVPAGLGNVVSHRPLIPSENAAFSLGKVGELGWSNVYIGAAENVYNGLRIIVGNGTHDLIGRDENGRYVIGNTDAIMYYHVKNVDSVTTGNAFKITSGNDDASNNTGSVWFFGGSDTTSRYIGSYPVYNRTYSAAANMYVTANGVFGRSTSSSRRYKTDIVDLDLGTVKGLYDLPVRQFKYNSDCLASDDERYGVDMPGFIAEEVADYLPIACDHIRDEDGNLIPEMWNSKIIVPALLKLIQDLNNRVKTLEGG